MDEIQLVATFGRPPWGPDVQARDGSIAELGALAFANLRRALVDHSTNVATINSDPDLSPSGKASRRADAAGRALGDLDRLSPLLNRMRARRSELAAKATPKGVTLDAATAVLVAKLWDLLPADPLVVGTVYRDALARGDGNTLLAVEMLPALHGGRPADAEMVTLRRERLLAEQPALVQELDQVEEAVGFVEQALTSAKNLLGSKPPDLEIRHSGTVTRVRLDEEAA